MSVDCNWCNSYIAEDMQGKKMLKNCWKSQKLVSSLKCESRPGFYVCLFTAWYFVKIWSIQNIVIS